MTRNRWTRIPVAVVLVAALAGMAPPAQAAVTTVLNGSFPYQGQGSHTRTFFEDVFEANIPDILAGAGKIKVGFALEATTKATVRAVSRLNVGFEGDLEPGRPLTVQTSQDSLNLLSVPELTLTTRPALRVVFDYEPDDTDAFECSPFQVSGEAPQATGDGDAICGRFEVALPDDALLLFEEFVPPYAGGSVALQADREIFSIPICAELAGLIGIGPLADICAIRLKAKVNANLTAGASAGYRATTSLVTDLALPGGGVVPGGLQLSDAGVTRWPSPDAVVQPFAVPCLDEGAPLYYRLDNNVYASRVDKVSLQAAVDFTIAGASTVEIEVGAPLDLLGEGNAIEVTATHQSVLARLGSIAADTHGPVVSAGGPYGGPGSAIRLQAVGAGPGASLVECEPAAVTYEWTFDDGSAASGAVVDKTFADNQPSPHQATLRATDRSGNTTSVPFSVAVQNVAPTARITSPTSRPVVPLGTVVDFAASAADPGTEDVLTYHWDFGDGTTRTVSTLSRTDSVAHRYTASCLCTATLDTSDPEASAPRQSVPVVVFDPAGKVTGGGGFFSGAGSVGVAPGTAYRMNASVQYDAGAAVPKGLTDLDVPATGTAVRVSTFDFLVVRGNEATWEGSATVNGVAGYSFRATLVMGSDQIPTETSLTLWRPGQTSPTAPDLHVGGPIDKGQIKTH